MEENEELYFMRAYYLRGKIISDTIHLERKMDDYLASYFCNDVEKKKDLMQSLLSTKRIIFENKRLIFDYVVNKANPDWVKKYPKFKNTLIKIIEQRNIMAHYLLKTGEDAIIDMETKMDFINFRDNIEVESFDKKRQANLIRLIELCTVAIDELIS
jgi:hypothetical protein